MRMCISLCLGLFLVAGACNRGDDRSANGAATSQILDNASPEALEALGVRVGYRITDQSFAQWEAAQRNLDRLPPSAVPASGGVGENVIDRAVSRLEASPKARTAIEASGLTVRDFILQTIALAQATEAVEGAPAQGAAVVPQENFRFVDRHRERLGRARAATRAARLHAERAQAQFRDELPIEADTLLQSETEATTLSRDGVQSPSRQWADTLNARSDSAESLAPERTPPDTVRDSISVDRPGQIN